MTRRRPLIAGLAVLLTVLGTGASEGAAAQDRFAWRSSPPVITPRADLYAVKDPSIVFANGRYHVFMTTAGPNGWGLAYTSFASWADAPAATLVPLDKSPMGPGYRAAPQVFYFAPQKLWYLVYQGGDPLYSTTGDIDDPLSWSAPKPFFPSPPDIVKNAKGNPIWLDFWTICNDRKCYLFFTDDHGDFFRAETALDEFPNGFHNTTRVMQAANPGDLFEAGNTYRIAGAQAYITLVEAIGPRGRYFRAWKADDLEGAWTPLSADAMNLFAGADNVAFDGAPWAQGISHGEMVRANADQTLQVDPCKPLQFLYQGLPVGGDTPDYIKLPYRLGLITAVGDNPVTAMCK